MGVLIGVISTLFRWAGAIRGLWTFIVPLWGFVRGRFGGAIPAPAR